jgi:hypothetical protein
VSLHSNPAPTDSTRSPSSVPPVWVLDEDEALELLAYLINAARTQVEEAAEYGPLRLLTAARRLAERIAPRSKAGLTPPDHQVRSARFRAEWTITGRWPSPTRERRWTGASTGAAR